MKYNQIKLYKYISKPASSQFLRKHLKGNIPIHKKKKKCSIIVSNNLLKFSTYVDPIFFKYKILEKFTKKNQIIL